MNFTTVLHQAKSEYAYAYNENTLHIRLKTERGAVRKVELLALDPFNWVPRNDGSMMYDLDKESIIRLEMRKEQMTEMYDCWFAEAGNLDTKRCKYCFVIETEKEKYMTEFLIKKMNRNYITYLIISIIHIFVKKICIKHRIG